MTEKTKVTGQGSANTQAQQDSIMQDIQGMIGSILKNTVDKMQRTELDPQLGNAPSEASGENEVPAQMDINDIKNFVSVMQKFIDNVNIMITQLETGSPGVNDTEDKFLDGYMATADNILEIAAFSMKDTLTGLSNRNGFDNRLILEWNRAIRDKSQLSLVIFGVEGFSGYEDQVRDDVLKSISKTLENSIKRSTDFLARWSDEEFATLLPLTDANGAKIVAERILMEIGNMNVSCIKENGCELFVSIGVGVQTPETNERPADFINKTHNAFIKAKEAGRGKVVFA